jgi:hypothetical protein
VVANRLVLRLGLWLVYCVAAVETKCCTCRVDQSITERANNEARCQFGATGLVLGFIKHSRRCGRKIVPQEMTRNLDHTTTMQ